MHICTERVETEIERKRGRESGRMNECIHKRAGEIRRKN